jgi:hypothetical protein
MSDKTRFQTFTAAVVDDTPIDLRGHAIYNHRLTWTGKGTRTTGNIKLQQSVDGTTWTDLIAAQSATTDGTATATGYCNFVRIYCTVISGTGNTIYATYEGTEVGASLTTVDLQDGTGNAITSTSNALDINIKSGLSADAAVGAAVSTTPIPITGKAVATQPAVVHAGDANYFSTTLDGRLIVKEAAPPQDEWQYTSPAAIEDTAPDQVKAGEAGYYLVVTAVLVCNDDATVGTWVQFTDATGGTVVYQGYAAAAGGGWAHGNGVGSLFIVPTVDNGLFVQCVTNSSQTRVSVRGYKTKVAP